MPTTISGCPTGCNSSGSTYSATAARADATDAFARQAQERSAKEAAARAAAAQLDQNVSSYGSSMAQQYLPQILDRARAEAKAGKGLASISIPTDNNDLARFGLNQTQDYPQNITRGRQELQRNLINELTACGYTVLRLHAGENLFVSLSW